MQYPDLFCASEEHCVAVALLKRPVLGLSLVATFVSFVGAVFALLFWRWEEYLLVVAVVLMKQVLLAAAASSLVVVYTLQTSLWDD